MTKEKINYISGLIVICILTLSGCATSNQLGEYNNEASLKMVNQYTLTSTKHFLRDYSPIDPNGNINVVVEIPTGTNEKWEVDKTTGELKWEFIRGKPRVVSYLGYPGNYGMIPRTLLPKELGGDGDPLDVIIIGSALPRGSVVGVRPIGVLKLLDDGEQDDKIIAILPNSALGEVLSIKDLKRKYVGITEILQIWFSNYKGAGRLQTKGFKSGADAQIIIKAAIAAYEDDKGTLNN